MTPTVAQVRAAVVDAINAGGFGVTATATWRGSRALEDLAHLRVEVAVTGLQAEPDTSDTGVLNRLVSVIVRRQVDPGDVAAVDQVVDAAERIGRHLLSTTLDVDAHPHAYEFAPVLDDDALADVGVAESIVTIRYESYGG